MRNLRFLVTVIGLAVLLALEPVFSDAAATPECPDVSSVRTCYCSADSSPPFLGIYCISSMTDADVDTLVGLIPPTTPMVALLIMDSLSVTRVPQNLAQFTSLKYLTLRSNAITSANADDFNNIPLLQVIDLHDNAITSVSGSFVLTGPLSTDSQTFIDFSKNIITSLADASFSLTDYNVGVDFTNNAITSVNGDTFTSMSATNRIDMYFSSNQISSLSGNFNFKITAADSVQTLYGASVSFKNNEITSISPATFYTNDGYLYLNLAYNLITSVNGEDTLSLITAPGGIALDFSSNEISSVSGNFNLNPSSAVTVAVLSFANNKITSISSATFSLIATSVKLTFTNNSLTSVPADRIILTGSTTSIQQGEFYPKGMSLSLSDNQISTLDANFVSIDCPSLETYSACQIDLSGNSLEKLDQGALQPILQSFAAGGLDTTKAFVDASSNPIDCSTTSPSVCYDNFGWLVADSISAPYVKNAACSDGKSIFDVNQASCLAPPPTQPPTPEPPITTPTTQPPTTRTTPSTTTTTRQPFIVINKPALMEMLGLTWIHSIFHSIFSG